MCGIKTFIVLPVASFHFAVMPGRIGTDQLMPDAVALQMDLEHGGLVLSGGKAVGEFVSIIRLDAFNGTGKSFDQMLQEHGRRIGVMLLEGFDKPPSGILVDSGILEELFSDHPAVNQTGRRNELHIDLDALAGVFHLFIGFRYILGIGRMNRHDALSAQEAVKPRNGTGVAPPHKFYPEDDQPGIRITPAHIQDKFDLFRGMLARMVMGPSGAFTKGFDRAVITAFPAVNILPVSPVFNSSFRDAELFSIFNQG